MRSAARPPSFSKAQRFDVATDHGAMVMCQICEFVIFVRDMEIDHELAVIDGGAHERLNWRPLCFSCHRIKSAREHKNNAKCKRVAKKHAAPRIPVKAWPSRPMQSRPFQKRPEAAE